MRASTLFVITFVVWITAKGKLKQYAQLATSKDVSSSEGSGSAIKPASLPDLTSEGNKLLTYFNENVA